MKARRRKAQSGTLSPTPRRSRKYALGNAGFRHAERRCQLTQPLLLRGYDPDALGEMAWQPDAPRLDCLLCNWLCQYFNGCMWSVPWGGVDSRQSSCDLANRAPISDRNRVGMHGCLHYLVECTGLKEDDCGCFLGNCRFGHGSASALGLCSSWSDCCPCSISDSTASERGPRIIQPSPRSRYSCELHLARVSRLQTKQPSRITTAAD